MSNTVITDDHLEIEVYDGEPDEGLRELESEGDQDEEDPS